MAAVVAVFIVPHPAGHGQARERLEAELEIAASELVTRMVRRIGFIGRAGANSFVLNPGNQLGPVGQVIGAAIFETIGNPGGIIDVVDAGDRIGAPSADIGPGIGQPAAKAAIGQIEVQAGISQPLPIAGNRLRVRTAAERGIRVDPAIAVIAAQIEFEIRRQIDPHPPVERADPAAIPLCPAGKHGKAIGAVKRAAEAVANRASAAGDIGLAARRVPRTIFGAAADNEAADRLCRFDVDHPADRLAAPDDRVGPAQDLDPGDVAGGQSAEIERRVGAGRIVDPHPIDQHQRLRGIAAAHEHAGLPAHLAALGHAERRQGAQGIGHGGTLQFVQPLAIDDRDGLPGLPGGLLEPAGEDDDVIRLGGFLGQNRRRQGNGG